MYVGSSAGCDHVIFNNRFDYFLYKAYLQLRSISPKSRTVYHIVVRELCGQFYYMCAQFLYFEENRTAFSSSSKEYSFQVSVVQMQIGVCSAMFILFRVNLVIFVCLFH